MYRIVLEDSIMQENKPVTAGSKILDKFVSPLTATVVNKLLDHGNTIVGKAKMNEFGIPNFFIDGSIEIPEAIKAVSDDIADYALCNDVFGQYRQKATEAGCCYIHPTYGTVSRFGLIPLVSSMDQIGVVCKSIPEGFKLLSQIAGSDGHDGAMFPEKSYDYANTKPSITLGIPEAIVSKADQETQNAIKDFAGIFNTVCMDLEYFDVHKQVMMILSSAEISNNISRYDGIKFGYRASGYKTLDDLYIKTRTEGLGLETKLAAIMGAMVLSQNQYAPYYEKAMKIRRLIKESLQFSEYDIIVLPGSISEDSYENLSLYALPNLAGLPCVSFAYKGQCIQLIANVKNEKILSSVWEVCMA